MEVLSHDVVVESILERVPVKSLLRFKFVSKRWLSTIESKNFQVRQLLIHLKQSPGLDVLFVTIRDPDYYDRRDALKGMIPLSSSSSSSSSLFYYYVDDCDDDAHTKIISSSIKIYRKKWYRWSTSCDGLICFCNKYESIIINPTTRWLRTFPPSNLQKQHRDGDEWRDNWLGFGKDKFNGTYKLVCLYNNTPYTKFDSKKTITTCEVFDFRNNAWRYVTCPASPYYIVGNGGPVHLEGSILWVIKCELEIQVLSFDLHTETFQVIAKAPFDRASVWLYNLNNRLCVCDTKYPNQVIWLFDSGSNTWEQMCSIDLDITYSWFRKSTKYEEGYGNCIGHLSPLAVLEEEKVLFYFFIHKESGTYFVIYDVQTKSFDFAFRFMSRENYLDFPICCFQSLISI